MSYPTDTRFRVIAAKIADAVQLRAGPVSARNKTWCRCPLGCFYTKGPLRPWVRPAALSRLGFTKEEYDDFVSGFDYGYDGGGPFSILGSAYRRRFP